LVKLKNYQEDEHNLPGNILLAAAIAAYLGPFTMKYRIQMLEDWSQQIHDLKIPVMQERFTLERVLATPILIRNWQMNGLPAD